MKPPYQITSTILNLVSSISEKIGVLKAIHLDKPSPELRRTNRIKTIQASLEIEGNSLSEAQITAILEDKRVIGPKKDILEVRNAIALYSHIGEFSSTSLSSFLSAHKILMKGLIDDPGQLRKGLVGILKGSEVSHVAPPSDKLHHLLETLFSYLDSSEDHVLIKSSVVHHEIELIHPFTDGNGRMGRLWQTLILTETYPIFEFLPFETIIKQRQEEYYNVLEKCDDMGQSTLFIEFMLITINDALDDLLSLQSPSLTSDLRLAAFISRYPEETFTRKDYMREFRELSTATASRDMRLAVELGMVEKIGDKRTTSYRILRS